MAQIIEVDGEPVEFPDDMSEAEIAQALAGNTGAKQPQQVLPDFLWNKMSSKAKEAWAKSMGSTGPESSFGAGVSDIAVGVEQLGRNIVGGPQAEAFNKQMQQRELEIQQRREAEGRGEGIDWKRMGGNIFNPTTLLGGGTLLKRPMADAAVKGAAFSAAMPTSANTPEEFFTNKAVQTGVGAVGGVGGTFVAQKAAGALNPITTKAEQTMADLGVQLTPGQRLGGQAATIEQFAQNLPLVGKFIANAKERGIYNFNKGVINKALGRVGEKLPEDVIGRDAVQYADEVVSQRYTDVLGKVQFTRDADLNKALGNVVKLPTDPRMRSLANTEIKSIVGARIPEKGGVVDGATYQAVESDLKKRAMAYMNSTTAAERDVGQALQEAANLLKKGLAKQNPEQASALRRINSAYGDIEVMRKASVATGSDNGVFTPKQYNAAVKAGDFGRQKKRFSRGQARGQDISEAAVETMSPPANSTIEGRLALGVGGGYAALQSPTTMTAAAALTPILYSPGGLRAMEAMMRSRPEIAREVGKIVEQRASKEGSITGAAIIKAYNEATKTADERAGK